MFREAICELLRLPLLLLLAVAVAVISVCVERWPLLLPMRPLLMRVKLAHHPWNEKECPLNCVTTADCMASLLSRQADIMCGSTTSRPTMEKNEMCTCTRACH